MIIGCHPLDHRTPLTLPSWSPHSLQVPVRMSPGSSAPLRRKGSKLIKRPAKRPQNHRYRLSSRISPRVPVQHHSQNVNPPPQRTPDGRSSPNQPYDPRKLERAWTGWTAAIGCSHCVVFQCYTEVKLRLAQWQVRPKEQVCQSLYSSVVGCSSVLKPASIITSQQKRSHDECLEGFNFENSWVLSYLRRHSGLCDGDHTCGVTLLKELWPPALHYQGIKQSSFHFATG